MQFLSGGRKTVQGEQGSSLYYKLLEKVEYYGGRWDGGGELQATVSIGTVRRNRASPLLHRRLNE